jgi:hypothetical protein
MPDAETLIALEADLPAVEEHAAEHGVALTRDENEPRSLGR